MATPRKSIGNAKRFRLFRRDQFRCQYCGRTPPAVVLHLDHVVPVAEGGGDEDENLLTSCSDCNHGKRDHIIDVAAVPRDYKSMGEEAKAKAKQLAEYRKHLQALRQELDQSIDMVGAAFWGSGTTWHYERGFSERSKVEHFINLLGLDEVVWAAGVARARIEAEATDFRIRQRFKYFCGVCWRRCTELGIRGSSDAD